MSEINMINLKQITYLIEKYEKIKTLEMQYNRPGDKSKVKFIGVVIVDLEDLLK